MEYVTKDSLSFFSEGDRQKKLSRIGDPLERLNAVINWELFRTCLQSKLYPKPRAQGVVLRMIRS